MRCCSLSCRCCSSLLVSSISLSLLRSLSCLSIQKRVTLPDISPAAATLVDRSRNGSPFLISSFSLSLLHRSSNSSTENRMDDQVTGGKKKSQKTSPRHSDDVKLQCNGFLYWDTFIIPNAIAVKHGWKISCLIKATSQGLGRVTASLAYHSGNLERPKVITAVQEVMVCEKVKIRTVETNDFSRPIRLSLSPRISQEVVLTAAGGCGKRLNDYNWFSSDSAIVAVSAAGLVLANKPGLAIIKAASVFDSSNFDEISVHAHISSQNPVLHGHHLNFSIIGEGQTEETGVGYLSAASVPPETEDVITWILIIAAINGILINGMAFLDTPNGGRQKCGMTPADDSQSESNLLSPETPRPYVDYLVRTIDETPYYQRGRRFDPLSY